MIKYWNPYTGREEVESVYGDKPIRLLYENPVGQKFADILSRPIFSKAYGLYQSSPLSKNKIPGFIKAFNINMAEFEPGPFNSFNDFFIRRFLPGKRKFAEASNELAAFAEGRYLAFEKVTAQTKLPVKGEYLTPSALLQNKKKAAIFEDGPVVIARLCPVDYHRFHFPDDGEVVDRWTIDGALQSVNPAALRFKNDIFATNERHVSILKTKNFGYLAYIEVGALLVGKIVQTHKEKIFIRGDEKGYFLFGASTVIVLGEKNKFLPNLIILKNSKEGLETFGRLGDKIATLVKI